MLTLNDEIAPRVELENRKEHEQNGGQTDDIEGNDDSESCKKSGMVGRQQVESRLSFELRPYHESGS